MEANPLSSVSYTLQEVLSNKNHLWVLISKMYSIEDFLDNQGARLVLCPFHHDSRPSSRIYDDEDGIARLHCYSCRRQFTSYDYIKRILEKDPVRWLMERHPPEHLEAVVRGINWGSFKKEREEKPHLIDALKVFTENHDLVELINSVYFGEKLKESTPNG